MSVNQLNSMLDAAEAALAAEQAAHAETRAALERSSRANLKTHQDWSVAHQQRHEAQQETARLREQHLKVNLRLWQELSETLVAAQQETARLTGQLDAAEQHVKIRGADLAEARAELTVLGARPGAIADCSRALLQMTRAWAMHRICFTGTNGNAAEAEARVPATVAALVRQHSAQPVGQCDRCGQRAPLRCETPGMTHTQICAWGCKPLKHPTPWRQGRRVPRNVYDAHDNPILMAPDDETAARIVEATALLERLFNNDAFGDEFEGDPSLVEDIRVYLYGKGGDELPLRPCGGESTLDKLRAELQTMQQVAQAYGDGEESAQTALHSIREIVLGRFTLGSMVQRIRAALADYELREAERTT